MTPARTGSRGARGPERARGFSLPELLMVLVIVSLMLAILLPMNAATRDVARKLQCGVQLQQIAVGVMGHTLDYNDRLPGPARRGVWLQSAYVRTGRPPQKNLPYHLDNYLGTNVRRASPTRDHGIEEAVWRCPANTSLDGPYPHAYINNQQSNTDAPYFFGNFSDFATPEQARPKGLGEVRSGGLSAADPPGAAPARSLSTIWMMGDIDEYNYDNGGWLRGVSPAHGAGTVRNYSFFDGHLESRVVLGSGADPPMNP